MRQELGDKITWPGTNHVTMNDLEYLCENCHKWVLVGTVHTCPAKPIDPHVDTLKQWFPDVSKDAIERMLAGLKDYGKYPSLTTRSEYTLGIARKIYMDAFAHGYKHGLEERQS